MSIDTETMVELSKPLWLAQSLEKLAAAYNPEYVDSPPFKWQVLDVLRDDVLGKVQNFQDIPRDDIVADLVDKAEALLAEHAQWVVYAEDDFDEHAECEEECDDDCEPDPYGIEWSRHNVSQRGDIHAALVATANQAYRANDKSIRDWNKANPTRKLRNPKRYYKVAA